MSLRSVVEKRPPGGSDAMVELSRAADALRNDALYVSKLSPAERQSLGAIADYDPPSPVAVLDNWGILEGFVAVHGAWPVPDDIGIFGKKDVSVSYNPKSNMYLASGSASKGLPCCRRSRDPWHERSGQQRQNQHVRRNARGLHGPEGTGAVAGGHGGPKRLVLDTCGNDRRRVGSENCRSNRKHRSREGGGHHAARPIKTRDVTFRRRRRGRRGTGQSTDNRDVRFVVSNGRLMVDDGRLTGRPEAVRAARLNTIARILDKRATDGQRWHEKINLTSEHVLRGWWRYRSVRAADEIAIEVVNSGQNPIELVIGFSGVTFGGTAPPTFHPASLERYPMETNANFFSKSFVLQPRASLQVSRASRGERYTLRYGHSEETRVSVAAEQIALFAAEGINSPAARQVRAFGVFRLWAE